jgi:hypothetical protein
MFALPNNNTMTQNLEKVNQFLTGLGIDINNTEVFYSIRVSKNRIHIQGYYNRNYVIKLMENDFHNNISGGFVEFTCIYEDITIVIIMD